MIQPKAHTRLSAVAREILAYLEQNPNACDTLVGITRWWLMKQRIEATTIAVQQALDELVKLELVLRNEVPHGPANYKAKKKK